MERGEGRKERGGGGKEGREGEEGRRREQGTRRGGMGEEGGRRIKGREGGGKEGGRRGEWSGSQQAYPPIQCHSSSGSIGLECLSGIEKTKVQIAAGFQIFFL